MPERYYVHNLETDKLNIFTGGKSDWLAIPEADRDRIKSACLWSRSINGWVSRSKGGTARFYSLDALKRNGFENRGTEGERLSFAEQVEAKQDRAEARAERFEDRAETAEATSTRLYDQAHTMADGIPFGQPVLIGHHSEKRDRNYREKIHNRFTHAMEAADKAKHYEGRAETARATAEGKQYSDPGYLERRIKECTAEIARLNRYLSDTDVELSETSRERWETLIAEQEDKLGFFTHCLDTCGKVIYNRETLKGKTEVKIRGRWETIAKLNPTTIGIPNICFSDPAYQIKHALKYGYGEVQDAR